MPGIDELQSRNTVQRSRRPTKGFPISWVNFIRVNRVLSSLNLNHKKHNYDDGLLLKDVPFFGRSTDQKIVL